MLKPIPLANALTAVTVAAYLICWIIFRISTDAYNFLMNSLSLGADVASFFQPTHTIQSLLVALVVTGITTWISGFFFAWLYNRWAKS